MENETAGAWQKLAIVYPQLPELTGRRVSVKFAKGGGGKRFGRTFWFDVKEKKFRYLHSPSDDKDQSAKAKDLAQCEYEVRSKDDPGTYPWDQDSSDRNYRLTMNFKQRPAGPIFFYSNDLNEVQALKGFGVFCKKTANKPLEGDLAKLLDSLMYNNGAFGYNRIDQVFGAGAANSFKVYKLMQCLAGGTFYLEDQKKMVLKAWANNVTTKAKHFKPKATMRLALFLQTLARIRDPSETAIYESTKRIVSAHEREREVTRGIFDDAIQEKANRRFQGMSAHATYEVSPAIEPIATGREEIPSENKEFTKFDFTLKPFDVSNSQVKIDYSDFKMNVVSRCDETDVYGSVPIDDISSIVLNEEPPRTESENLKWLKVNGRKIKEPERYGRFQFKCLGNTLNDEEYIDPASRFYALSVDSYLTKKNLLELILHSVRLKDATDVKTALGTDELRLRLKINSGNIFWTSTPFVAPKMRNESISCDFKQICRVRINRDSSDHIRITLSAVAAEGDRLPDTLKTLKKEVKLGSKSIPLSSIVEQKKLTWIPLNGGLLSEDNDTDKTTPMLAMNMRIIDNVSIRYNL